MSHCLYSDALYVDCRTDCEEYDEATTAEQDDEEVEMEDNLHKRLQHRRKFDEYITYSQGYLLFFMRLL